MRSSFFCTLLLLTPQLSQAQDLAFVVLSDPQFGMYTENRGFAQETANFEFAISTVNRLHPAFVVVCGDLTNKAGDSAQIAEYQRIVKRLDRSIPIYSLPGNHDVGNEPTAESLAAYRASYGRDYYTFRQGNLEGIVLNSSLIQHPDRAAAEAAKQEAWLDKELQAAQRDGVGRVLVFQHIPWFLQTADEPDQYFNIPTAIRSRYLALFDKYGVHEVFAGHYHRNAEGRSATIHMTTTGPVGKPIGPDPSGIRIVTVNGPSVESQYYGLGNLPNTLSKPLTPPRKP